MEVKLFLDKNVNENANFYFEKAKKLKAKLPGLEVAITETKSKIAELEENKVSYFARKEKDKKIKIHKKKEWYEKFRWTILSSGHLFIMGNDATSNEVIIKKYTDPQDLVFHTSAPASPFGILKNIVTKDFQKEKDGGETQKAIFEAGQILCCFSAQWKKGFGTANCFWVFPEQVSKTANSGEFISKGSFMIRGEKNELKNLPLQICLGVRKLKIETDEGIIEIDEAFSGSQEACVKFCGKRFIKLEPGTNNYKKLNKEIKEKLKFHIDELPKYIPNDCKILKK